MQASTLPYQETPTVEIRHPDFDRAGVRLCIKCEYANHPFVSGNKWWKLKYNLPEAHGAHHKTLLTFGGAYSNHIYATAAAAQETGIKAIGVIRGEQASVLSPTLTFARDRGMQLHFVSREEYRHKNDEHFIADLHQRFGDFNLIPEGGTNALAIRGMEAFGRSLPHYDYYALPVGTGGSLAGLANALAPNAHVLGFSSLKGGNFLEHDIRGLGVHGKHWTVISDYHFGGYGKISTEVTDFVRSFHHQHGIALDVVYTAKMMMGLIDKARNGFFNRGTQVLAIHTGGLQGNAAHGLPAA